MFVVWGNTTGFGSDEEISLDYAFQEEPIWSIISLIGMLLMFAGPLHYWSLDWPGNLN